MRNLIFAVVVVAAGLQASFVWPDEGLVVALGKQPDLVVDAAGTVGLLYGNDKQVYYQQSADGGKSFSAPETVGSLPKLALGMGRAPQLALTKDYVVVSASDFSGNIYTWRRPRRKGAWSKAVQVNDADTVAKEAFVSLAAGRANETFAVWLDLRGDRRNKIYGARSADGGQTWEKNQLIYRSPEGTVCECCKPSVIADGAGRVAVQFRNWLNGSRDLHLIASRDHGRTFGTAQKLGTGTWVLKGCPMDGGDLAIDNKGTITTVWRREGNIYLARPGEAEQSLGAGRTPTLTLTAQGPAVAWMQNGSILYRSPQALAPVNLGKGTYPKLATLPDGKRTVCAWEQDGQVVVRVLGQ